MLRTYVYNDSKSKWVEEDRHLLSHDTCVILDEENEILYLWRGPKNSKRRFKKGYMHLKEIVSSFPELNLQFIMVTTNFPSEVLMKLDSISEKFKKGGTANLLFSRLITINIYFIILLGTIIIPIISLFNLSSSLLWPNSNGNYVVINTTFQIWINFSEALIYITLILFFINLIIGVIEIESQVIIFSLIGFIICVGLAVYLNFDIFLFIFQEGSTLTNFLILRKDIWFFLFIHLISIMMFEIPSILKLISFLKTYRKFMF